jgi:hypothetical protein
VGSNAHRRSPSLDELVQQHDQALEPAPPGRAGAPRVHVPPRLQRFDPRPTGRRPRRGRSLRPVNVNAATHAVAEAPSPGVPHSIAADRRGVTSTMATSSARDHTEATGQRHMTGWQVRGLVACPTCRASVGHHCWGGRVERATRKSNHIARRRAAELLRT